MKRYRASGRFSFGGFIGLILVSLLGGAAIGGLAFAVSHLIYLIVLFPIVMGAIGGGLLVLVVKGGKVRSPILVFLFSILIGVVMIGTMHFLGYYIDFRNEFHNAVVENGGGISAEEEAAFLDEILEEETGDKGFIGYMKLSAQEGFTITRGSSETMIQGNGAWVYWGAELIGVIIIAAVIAVGAARQPFNEEVGEWYPIGLIAGNVAWDSRKAFRKLLKNADYNEAAKLVNPGAGTMPYLALVVQGTPSAPQSDVVLSLKEIRLNRGKTIEATVMTGVLSPSEVRTLLRMNTAPKDSVEAALSQSSPVIG